MLTECHVYMHIVVCNNAGFVACGEIKVFVFFFKNEKLYIYFQIKIQNELTSIFVNWFIILVKISKISLIMKIKYNYF